LNSKRLFYLIPTIVGVVPTVFFIIMVILGIFPIASLSIPIQVLAIIGIIFLCAISITHNSLNPEFPEGVFTGIINNGDKGRSSFKCGNCGEVDRFIYIEINKDLHICSHCGEYNLFIDSENVNK
jgi:amino acid transporter